MGFAIYLKNRCIERCEDLVDALRRSRKLAEALSVTLDVRDETRNVILAVTLSSKSGDVQAMNRAARHNTQRLLEEYDRHPNETCVDGHGQHEWQDEPPLHQHLSRCSRCNVLGYNYAARKRPTPLTCSVCGEPATTKRNRKVLKHRWGCAKHVDP